MSWDVLLMTVPSNVTSVDQLPRDFRSPPLGALTEVLERLKRCASPIDLSDPTWGMLSGETWSIEVNIGEDDPVKAVMLHVRGAGDDVLPVIHDIATVLVSRVIDCSTGDFLAEGDVGAWHAFQAYRDRVLKRD